MRLIVFSYPDVLPNEAKQINALFDAGMQRFHLRKPNVEYKDWKSILQSIRPEYRNKIVIHNHFELMEGFELYGKHLKGSEKGILKEFTSAACHSLNELDEKKEVREYLFLSPIYDSISKKDYNTGFDFDSLKSRLKEFQSKDVIALGGITIDKLEDASSLGFDGVAVLGAIWNSNNPTESFKQLQKHCE